MSESTRPCGAPNGDGGIDGSSAGPVPPPSPRGGAGVAAVFAALLDAQSDGALLRGALRRRSDLRLPHGLLLVCGPDCDPLVLGRVIAGRLPGGVAVCGGGAPRCGGAMRPGAAARPGARPARAAGDLLRRARRRRARHRPGRLRPAGRRIPPRRPAHAGGAACRRPGDAARAAASHPLSLRAAALGVPAHPRRAPPPWRRVCRRRRGPPRPPQHGALPHGPHRGDDRAPPRRSPAPDAHRPRRDAHRAAWLAARPAAGLRAVLARAAGRGLPR